MKHKNGILGSVVFHIIILILLFVFGFTTPLPLPAEQGILINFGDMEFGSGNEEPEEIEEKPKPQQQKESIPVPVNDAVDENMTQDFEDAPVIEKKIEKKENKPVDKPEPEEKKEEKPVEKPKTVNQKALYQGKSSSSTNNQGEGTYEKPGNQGSLDGTTDPSSHFVGGNVGGGPEFSLAGRKKMYLPPPEYNVQKEGKVVVEITVDRTGKVINAIPGYKGSTTLDTYLLSVAKRAAMLSKFDAKSDAQIAQKGTITYYFKLQ